MEKIIHVFTKIGRPMKELIENIQRDWSNQVKQAKEGFNAFGNAGGPLIYISNGPLGIKIYQGATNRQTYYKPSNPVRIEAGKAQYVMQHGCSQE